MKLHLRERWWLFTWTLLVACGSEPENRGTVAVGGLTSTAGSASPGAGGTVASGGTIASGGTPSAGGSGVAEAGRHEGGSSGSAGAASTQAGTGASGAAGASSGSLESQCLAAATDACQRCVCTHCAKQISDCNATSGCPEIVLCIRESGCNGVDCYCGTFNAAACAAGQANGSCKETILKAPSARMPTLLAPSAGPASDAAVAISQCMQADNVCTDACL